MAWPLPDPTRTDDAPPAPSGPPGASAVDRSARLGALAVATAVLVFAVGVGVSLGLGAAYLWGTNMLSDLGDGECRPRGGRWICSPGHAMFNIAMVTAGLLLTLAAAALGRLWGRLLATSLAVMGVGLVVAGVFPAGDDGRVHLVGVVLALVVPGFGLLVSAMRPETEWLRRHRVPRGVLGAATLVFCAESRLPANLLPAGAGELVIVACLLLALILEAARALATRRGSARVSR